MRYARFVHESPSSPVNPEVLRAAANDLGAARRVAILTGAGISRESDIPTFRDSMDSLWKSFDPQTLATPEAFARDPETVTSWYDHRRLGCLAAEPNPGHRALADLEQRLVARGGTCCVLTQNVDRLHQRGGSVDVVELHGTIMTWRCARTGRPAEVPEGPMEAFPPPSPHAEGAFLRPDVVWFGEALPADALDRAFEETSHCDCFLTVGTSSVVHPAAGFIDIAADRGVPVIEVNPGETAVSDRVTHRIAAPSGVALPALVDAAFPTG